MEYSISTVKSRVQYRATFKGKRLLMVLNSERTHVLIYTATSYLGGYKLEDFGGSLTPANIRQFFDRN